MTEVKVRSGVKAFLLFLALLMVFDGFGEDEAFAARRRGGRRVRRGGAARVQARKGGRRNKGRGGRQARRNGNRNRNNNNNNRFVNGFDLDRLGQVFINDAALGANQAFLDGSGFGNNVFAGNNGLNNGFGNLNQLGFDPNTLQLVNGSSRIAFVTDRFGRQIPVELRDGAVVNGQIVNPSFDSINQPLLQGINGNGIFAGAGQQGQFLPGTLQDIKLFNSGELRSRGSSVVIRPGGGRRAIAQ